MSSGVASHSKGDICNDGGDCLNCHLVTGGNFHLSLTTYLGEILVYKNEGL